jgi:hypothetical protein
MTSIGSYYKIGGEALRASQNSQQRTALQAGDICPDRPPSQQPKDREETHAD